MRKLPDSIRALLTGVLVPVLAVTLMSLSGCGGGGDSVTYNGPPKDENGNPIAPDRSQMGAAGGGAPAAAQDPPAGAGNAAPADDNAQFTRGGRRVQRTIGAAGPGGTVAPVSGGNNNNRPGNAPAGAGRSGASAPLVDGGLANGLYPQPNPGFSQVGFGGGLNANFTVPVSTPGQPGGDANTARNGFSNEPAGNIGAAGAPAALTLLDRANSAFGEGDEKKAFQYLYAHLLVDDAAIEDYPLEWYSGLSQPRVAFRWGVGIQYNPASNFEGNPPVIGDPENVRIANAAPADGGRGSGGSRSIGAGGGGGGLLAGDGGGGGDAAPQDSPYKNVDTRTPQGMLVYYTGDYGDKLMDRLEFRRDNAYYGRLLQMAKIDEPVEEEAAGSEFNNRPVGRRNGPPRGGSQRTIGAAGPGGGGGGNAGGAGGFIGDEGGNRGGNRGGGAVGNDGISLSQRVQQLIGNSVARKPDDNKIGTLYPGVMLIGLSTKSELLDRARELGLDGLLIFNVKVSSNSVPETTTSLKLFNLHPQEGQREEVASVTLKHKEVARRRESGRGSDPVESALNQIFEEAADLGFRAGPMPELRAEHVEGRVGQLMGETHADPLRPAVEVVSFFRQGLLKEEYAVKALDVILGEGMGERVLSLNEEERIAAVSRFFPGDDLASAGGSGRGNRGGRGSFVSTNANALSYENDIAPIIQNNCGQCHVRRAQGDFSMASFRELMDAAGGDAVVPGEPENSLIVQVIEEGVMPPRGSVSAGDLDKIKTWISQGAHETATSSAGSNMAAAPDKPTIGELAPEIESEDLDGVTFRLSDYRGKVVLLDFWGDW